MNLEPFDGSTLLYMFIVTSLGILAFSICVVWLTNSATVRRGWEQLKHTTSVSGPWQVQVPLLGLCPSPLSFRSRPLGI